MYVPSCQTLQKWISENRRMEGLAQQALSLLTGEIYQGTGINMCMLHPI